MIPILAQWNAIKVAKFIWLDSSNQNHLFIQIQDFHTPSVCIFRASFFLPRTILRWFSQWIILGPYHCTWSKIFRKLCVASKCMISTYVLHLGASEWESYELAPGGGDDCVFFWGGGGGDGLSRRFDMSCFLFWWVLGGGKIFERCIISFIIYNACWCMGVYYIIYRGGVHAQDKTTWPLNFQPITDEPSNTVDVSEIWQTGWYIKDPVAQNGRFSISTQGWRISEPIAPF